MEHGSFSNYNLHTWCKEGKYEKVKELLSTCKDLSVRLSCRRGTPGYTPIHEAVSEGHSRVLELLLRYGGDVNCRANNGSTPLHLAASNGYLNCVQVLLTHNADISATDDSGRSPVQVAELGSRHDVLKALRSAGKCPVYTRS